MIIGMVRSTDPLRHEAEIERICADHGVPYEIKYSSTNTRTVACKQALIDYFCGDDELEFRCIVKRSDVVDLNRYKNNLGIPEKDMAYNHTYQRLLEFNLGYGERAMVYIDDKSRTKSDNLIAYLQWNVTRAADVQPKDSKDFRLIQLADLLIGCVYGELTDNRHPAKLPVHGHLLARRGLRTFKHKCPGDKFQVWHWRPK